MTVDLDALRPPAAPPPARRGAGLFVGAVLALGALAWGGLLLKDTLLPAREVRTAPVTVLEGAAAAATSFDATGWVEPDPFPVHVRPLVDGIVERFEVVEGDVVKAGVTVLARLRNAAVEDEVERMAAALAHTKAHLPEVAADVTEATRALELKLELRAAVARADGAARTAVAERAAAQAEVAVAERELGVARAELEAQAALERGGGGVPVARAKAEAAVAAAEAAVTARRAAVARAEAAAAAAEAEAVVAREALAHPVALEAALARSQAHAAAAAVEVAEYETDLAIARRNRDRLTVLAPVDGVVLLRKAAPGSAVGPGFSMRRGGGGEAMGGERGAEGDLLDLYDPARLQVRVNVPLAHVGAVGRGQAVELRADPLPGRVVRGEVVRLTALADRANNTLEAKVRVVGPEPLLKPEMVVRARFVTPAAPGAAADAVRLAVPRAALRGDAVFVLDPRRGGRARRVPVTTVEGAGTGDLVEVRGELSRSQRVVLDAVGDGDRVADGGGA